MGRKFCGFVGQWSHFPAPSFAIQQFTWPHPILDTHILVASTFVIAQFGCCLLITLPLRGSETSNDACPWFQMLSLWQGLEVWFRGTMENQAVCTAHYTHFNISFKNGLKLISRNSHNLSESWLQFYTWDINLRKKLNIFMALFFFFYLYCFAPQMAANWRQAFSTQCQNVTISQQVLNTLVIICDPSARS